MSYDFDRVIDRHNTDCIKYDAAVKRGYPADVLPLWVADMDFQAPTEVLEALRGSVDHGIFGYTEPMDSYYEAVAGWFESRFGWRPERDWMVVTPGVVFALATAVRAFTQPGEAVLIQPPVYAPFTGVVKSNGRTVVESPLTYENGAYAIDFADFEAKIADNDVKLFILCSPHNPIGKVWTAAELRRMAGICKAYGVTVVSDEIHCDFAFPEHPHTPFLMAAPELSDSAVVCTAPSKSFNLAGLQVSNIWIPGEKLRRAFQDTLNATGYSGINTLGMAACRAAYTSGGPWLDACKAYMRANLDYTRAFLAERIPQIRMVEPQGTYFAWLDCTGLGMTADELNDLIVHKAKLWLDAGGIFGSCAALFQRVVLACPRTTLQQALEQLAQALNG